MRFYKRDEVSKKLKSLVTAKDGLASRKRLSTKRNTPLSESTSHGNMTSSSFRSSSTTNRQLRMLI